MSVNSGRATISEAFADPNFCIESIVFKLYRIMNEDLNFLEQYEGFIE
jgi:hypothetical protein